MNFANRITLSALVFLLFTSSAWAQFFEYESMTFLGNPLDKTAQIMDCNTSISGDLVIPETVEGLTVTAISTAAFENCDKLTSVKIPNTVTTIWSEAFKDCYNLQSVQLSSALT